MRSVATGRGFTISVAASARSSARALPLTLYELLLLEQSLLLQVLCTHKSLREVERSANLLPGEAPLAHSPVPPQATSPWTEAHSPSMHLYTACFSCIMLFSAIWWISWEMLSGASVVRPVMSSSLCWR